MKRLAFPALIGLVMMLGSAITVIGCELSKSRVEVAAKKKPPDDGCACDGCSYLTCSIMSARIRNKLISTPGCQFHPIFTALYSFHCAFFAGEPTQAQQEACTQAMQTWTCGSDGVATLDDLPPACTTALGLPTEIRW